MLCVAGGEGKDTCKECSMERTRDGSSDWGINGETIGGLVNWTTTTSAQPPHSTAVGATGRAINSGTLLRAVR